MKKIKQLFIITLCLAMTLTTLPSLGENMVAPCDHFLEEPADN